MEAPDIDPAFVTRLIDDLRSKPPAVAIFQTGVGTRALFQATDALELTGTWLAALRMAIVVVRGAKPTAALRARDVRIDLSAADPFTTHEVLSALSGTPLAGARVLVQRYGVTNVELEEALRAKGAEVIEVPTYRWDLPEDLAPLTQLMDALDRGEIDAVAFTNAAQVHNLFAVAEQLGRGDRLLSALNRTLVASIGPVASAALTRFGVNIGIEASPPKLGPFMSALDVALSA
jgi:uroporphyrinogen-III synthase